ncbi:hypothetical protein JXA80_12800, partial [bacterium]|nr:hypothetical protein [candidate division CSSED10-310 bacterium]
MNRKQIKLGRIMMKEGRFIEAAEMFESAGDRESAMDAWAKGRRFDRAAELAIVLGRGDTAAGYYLRGGMYLELAEFYKTRKDYTQAGKYFTHSGHHESAAEMYEQLLKAFPQLKDIPGQKIHRSDEEIKVTRYTASAHAKAGNHSRAAELYHRIEAFSECAENLIQIKDYRNAGEAYEIAGLLAQAGHAYSEGGLHADAAR